MNNSRSSSLNLISSLNLNILESLPKNDFVLNLFSDCVIERKFYVKFIDDDAPHRGLGWPRAESQVDEIEAKC